MGPIDRAEKFIRRLKRVERGGRPLTMAEYQRARRRRRIRTRHIAMAVSRLYKRKWPVPTDPSWEELGITPEPLAWRLPPAESAADRNSESPAIMDGTFF